MIRPGERALVAVSGGKDSLAVWDLLRARRYEADGLYIGLGIGDYSDESGVYARVVRRTSAAGPWLEVDLREQYGYDIPTGSRAARAQSVLGLWPVEAAPLRQGGARRRLRRVGDGPQPR